MDHSHQNLLDVIQEELLRLGIEQNNCDNQKEFKRFNFYSNGAKYLGFTNNNSIKYKYKLGNFCDSPKTEKKNEKATLFDGPKTPKLESRKKTPQKSHVAAKNKFNQKSGKKDKVTGNNGNLSQNLFGCNLEENELCPACLQDGTVVYIPEFVIDANNIIRKNVAIEGIFRKAGSAYRQNEMKKLLNSGRSLPSSVHPIDAACLLKQFLRSLPTPLLSHHIHFLMTRCLEIPKVEQHEALRLCSLLLAKPQQDLLVYVLELFSFVAASCEENLMDAHNLAIVLAPNLLPASSRAATSAKKGVWASEDQLLAATIDVIQLLIDGAGGMCRLSEKLTLAIQNREKSQSTESLDTLQPQENPKKKRRSASIHRLVNGLKRVVQAGTGSLLSSGNPSPAVVLSPSVTVLSPPVQQDKSVEVCMDPDADLVGREKPSKRKSDSFEPLSDRGEETSEAHPGFLPPTKKARREPKHTFGNSVRNQRDYDRLKVKNPKAVKSLVTVRDITPEHVKRSCSLRERKEFRTLGISPAAAQKILERRKSLSVAAAKTSRGMQNRSRNSFEDLRTPSKSPYHDLARRKSFHSPKSVSSRRRSSVTFGNGLSSSTSKQRLAGTVLSNNICQVQTGTKRPSGSNPTSVTTLCKPTDPKGPSSIKAETGFDRRLSGTKPSWGSDTPTPFPSPGTPIEDLEKRYDEIKSVVQSMEAEVDQRNLKDLKENYFKEQTTPEFSSMSCSQLINDAYEKMKVETRQLEANNVCSSPAENLSRRLGRELKIRSRKSDEHRVLRSPSERRIGNIRRRSKEMEQGSPKFLLQEPQSLAVETPAKTPRLKPSLLMQSPQVNLKRGKPNSINSGLPLVVKPFTPRDFPGSHGNGVVSPRRICVSKRRLSSRSSVGESREGLYDDDEIQTPYSGPITRRMSGTFLITPSRSGREDSYNLEGESFTKGCTVLLSSSGRDLSGCDTDWVPAADFLSDKEDSRTGITAVTPNSAAAHGNRPSIAALKRQKKVTTNVQLFSQLQLHDPSSSVTSRQSFIHKRTPPNYAHPPVRNVYSEKCGFVSSERSPAVGTSPRIPLSSINFRSVTRIQSPDFGLFSQETTPAMNKRNPYATNPDVVGLCTPRLASKGRVGNLKRPETSVIPHRFENLPPRPFKPPYLSPRTPRANDCTPKLPPRIPKSPIINYR